MITLGSLFSGSGGFELAGALTGIVPVWASEIEPYPIAVTTSRFPQMKHLGNVIDIRGDQIPPVDVVTFGSPCQDQSVAGKQVGLRKGKRSSLFFEAIRMIREMRCATNGQYPRFAVFENVPGLFSSARGADFRTVLQAFVGLCDDTISIPEPPKGRWLRAGEIMGDHYSIAWRVQGAEYWGVPQRRDRIFLVADFAAGCAGKVLFEQESLRGHPASGAAPGQGASTDVEGSLGRGSKFPSGRSMKACDITSTREHTVDLPAEQPVVCSESGPGYWMPGFGCLRAEGENRPSRPGHLICFAQNQRNEVRNPGDHTGALSTEAGMKQQPCLVYTLQGNGIDRANTARCNGCGWKSDVCYTLNTIDRHAVCYRDSTLSEVKRQNAGKQDSSSVNRMAVPLCTDARGNGDGQICSTVIGDHERRVTDYTHIIAYGGERAETLDASYYKGPGARNGREREFIAEKRQGRKYIVRRLTTTECARLQGFPDCWAIPVCNGSFTDGEAAFWEQVRKTHADANGRRYRPYAKREQLVRWYNRLHTDSSEYRLYGNGIALPCAVFVLRGIVAVLKEGDLCG